MSNTLPTDYQNFIAVSRYARWLDDKGRRETWSETVSRYVDYMHNKVKFSKQDKYDIEQAILGLEVILIPTPIIRNFFSSQIMTSCKIPQIFLLLIKISFGHLNDISQLLQKLLIAL